MVGTWEVCWFGDGARGTLFLGFSFSPSTQLERLGFGVSRLQVAMVTSLPTLYGTGSPINFPGTSSQVHLLAMSLIECYEDLGVFYILFENGFHAVVSSILRVPPSISERFSSIF